MSDSFPIGGSGIGSSGNSLPNRSSVRSSARHSANTGTPPDTAGKKQESEFAANPVSGSGDEFISSAKTRKQEPVLVKLPDSTPKKAKPADPIAEMIKAAGRKMIESAVTRVLENSGVTLKEGDVLAMKVDGKGKLTVDPQKSSIDGSRGDQLTGLCEVLTEALNGETMHRGIAEESGLELTEERQDTVIQKGDLLGDAVLKQFSRELDFDINTARRDETFCVDFTISYSPKSDKNSIYLHRMILNGLVTELQAVKANRPRRTEFY